MVKASQYTKPTEEQSRKQQETQTWNLQRLAAHDQLPPARAHLLKIHNLKQRPQLGNTKNSAPRWRTSIPSKSLWNTSDSNQSIFLKAPKALLSSHNVKILCIWDGQKKDWTKARPKPSCTTIKSRLRNTRCHCQNSKWFGYSHASGTATWSRYGCSLGLALFGAYSFPW